LETRRVAKLTLVLLHVALLGDGGTEVAIDQLEVEAESLEGSDRLGSNGDVQVIVVVGAGQVDPLEILESLLNGLVLVVALDRVGLVTVVRDLGGRKGQGQGGGEEAGGGLHAGQGALGLLRPESDTTGAVRGTRRSATGLLYSNQVLSLPRGTHPPASPGVGSGKATEGRRVEKYEARKEHPVLLLAD
jgi:hypothetical protein